MPEDPGEFREGIFRDGFVPRSLNPRERYTEWDAGRIPPGTLDLITGTDETFQVPSVDWQDIHAVFRKSVENRTNMDDSFEDIVAAMNIELQYIHEKVKRLRKTKSGIPAHVEKRSDCLYTKFWPQRTLCQLTETDCALWDLILQENYEIAVELWITDFAPIRHLVHEDAAQNPGIPLTIEAVRRMDADHERRNVKVEKDRKGTFRVSCIILVSQTNNT